VPNRPPKGTGHAPGGWLGHKTRTGNRCSRGHRGFFDEPRFKKKRMIANRGGARKKGKGELS